MQKLLIIFLILFPFAISARVIPDSIPANSDVKYILRLKTGDEFTGFVVDNGEKDDYGKYLKLQTTLGVPKIYYTEIDGIQEYENIYKNDHRVFLMPTAEPIAGAPFIGNYEAFLFYGGFGITQYFSLTAGRTAIPLLYPGQQFSLINVKSTFLTVPFDSIEGHLSLALGANASFLNDDNRLIHIYTAATLRFKRSSFTTTVFFKTGSDDFYEIDVMDLNPFPLYYANGTIGFGMGVDTKFPGRNNLFFTGEIWNKDIANLRSTCFSMGLRSVYDKLSMEYGFMLFTNPYIVPYFGFTWTPFN
jgi:hypothetical protein